MQKVKFLGAAISAVVASVVFSQSVAAQSDGALPDVGMEVNARQEVVGAVPEHAAAAVLRLDLNGCLAYALNNALDLAQQRLSLDNSTLATLIARQKYMPSVAAQMTRSENGEDRTSGSATLKQTLPWDLDISAGASRSDLSDSESASYTIALSKRILGGGTLAESNLEIDRSLIDEVVAANRLAVFERELARKVTRQFFQIHRARQTLAIRERRLEASKVNVENALAREDPLDIANAQLEVPVSEAALMRAQREIANALDSMKQLIGAPLDEPIEIVGDVVFATTDVDVEADIARSAETHEEVLNKRLDIKKLELQLPVLRSKVLPAVDLSVNAVNRDGGDESDARDWSYEARASASWTLFSRGERASLRRLKNQLLDARIGLDILLRDRATTTRSLARSLEEARRQVEIGRQGLELATRRATLYSDRWENGAIDILEYIRSQNDLEERRVSLVDLEINYLETLIDYRLAVGDDVRITP